MPPRIAKLFRNGDSQAVRLPKEFRFQGTEVVIRRAGDSVVLSPVARTWDSLVQSLGEFPADFMADRDQPTAPDNRDSWDR
jgi:antitoxin VapB